MTQMTEITQGDLTVGAHSQGTLMTQNGMTLNKEELSNIVQNNPESKFLVGYAGSPVNHNDGEALVRDIYGGEEAIKSHIKDAKIADVFRSNVTPQDAVGSILGYQSAGINNSENLGSNMWESLLVAPRLFGIGGDSSHSYYPCVIGCGEESFTPQKDFYFNPNAPDKSNESPMTEYYKDNFTNKQGQATIDMNLLPQTDKSDATQTILNTTGGQQ
ncbi:hypothetical protein KJ988_03800 [bacterium]|nr:hypothetical protein [bacterium]